MKTRDSESLASFLVEFARPGRSTHIPCESPREDPGNLLLVPSGCYVGLILLHTNVTAINLRHESSQGITGPGRGPINSWCNDRSAPLTSLPGEVCCVGFSILPL